jgi:hypothetical protein
MTSTKVNGPPDVVPTRELTQEEFLAGVDPESSLRDVGASD